MTSTEKDGLVHGSDGVLRCSWGDSTPEYRAYHDDEWGRPVAADTRLFEMLSLEGFQAGLSWLTILRKREAFRSAFAGFDPELVARFGKRDVTRLLQDAAIVRHRGKIEAVVGNAARALELIDAEGSIAAYVWRFEPVLPDVKVARAAVREREEAPGAGLRRTCHLRGRGRTQERDRRYPCGRRSRGRVPDLDCAGEPRSLSAQSLLQERRGIRLRHRGGNAG